MNGYNDIVQALGKQNCAEAVLFFEQMLQRLEILPPENASNNDLEILASSVNIQRLRNHPVRLDRNTIKALYKEILEV